MERRFTGALRAVCVALAVAVTLTACTSSTSAEVAPPTTESAATSAVPDLEALIAQAELERDATTTSPAPRRPTTTGPSATTSPVSRTTAAQTSAPSTSAPAAGQQLDPVAHLGRLVDGLDAAVPADCTVHVRSLDVTSATPPNDEGVAFGANLTVLGFKGAGDYPVTGTLTIAVPGEGQSMLPIVGSATVDDEGSGSFRVDGDEAEIVVPWSCRD